MQLKIKVVRYVDHGFPGWIECEFLDAENRRHTIIEKVPIVSDEWFGPETTYPQDSSVACEILAR